MKNKVDKSLNNASQPSATPSDADAESPAISGGDKPQDDLREARTETPEVLRRKRMGRLDRELARVDEKGAHERAE
jgi:hypothetical protein